MIDDFESYTTSAELRNIWNQLGGSFLSLSSKRSGADIYRHICHQGLQSMELNY